MIEVEQAWQLIAPRTLPLPVDERPVGAGLVGKRLCAPVHAQRDSPPFQKSMMDGFAVRAADVLRGVALPVAGAVFAGHAPPNPLEPGTAVRIMTGAELPAGAGAVVVVEQSHVTREDGAERVIFSAEGVKPGANVMPAGRVWKAGHVLLDAGHRLRATDIGLLAESGASSVTVFRQPTVAVLATGDELVPVGENPGPGKIVNSNGLMLESLALRGSASVWNLGVARDRPEDLLALVREGLQADILVLTGGVSAGQADLVPAALAECGVQQVFHQVSVKPGKPVWYGTASVDGRKVHVFGLPGNPVSSLVCFELFVRLAIERLGGSAVERPKSLAGVLAAPHQARGSRPTWWPVRATIGQACGVVLLQPLEWLGSSDQRPLSVANGLACFPPRETAWEAGDLLQWLPVADFPPDLLPVRRS